jgi:hypothetical protein
MRIYMYDDEERGGRHDADESIAGRVFSSQEECGAFVAQLLAGELPGEIAQHVAARLAARCKDKQVPALGIAFRINRWVIRQEDLGFFNVLRTAALAGLAAVSGASAAAPVVGALAAAAETGWNLWRKASSSKKSTCACFSCSRRPRVGSPPAISQSACPPRAHAGRRRASSRF